MPLSFTVETSRFLLQSRSMMASAARLARLDSGMPRNRAARFPRTARLLRHADFERVYKQGRRHFSATMTFFYLARAEAETAAAQGLRVGFTVGRALGGAVQRNRMKRRLREAVRLSLQGTAVAADVVINPKKSLLAADFAGVVNEVSQAFAVIGERMSQKASRKLARTGGGTPESESRS